MTPPSDLPTTLGSAFGCLQLEPAHAPTRAGKPEPLEIRFGSGDPFGPLDSDDIEWLQEQARRKPEAAPPASSLPPPSLPNSRPCSFYGTPLHPTSAAAPRCPSIEKHERACRVATPAERAFYRKHRRWPRNAREAVMERPDAA